MKRFAALYRELDRSTATSDKRAALVAYFRDAPPGDAAWALWLLSGSKLGKIASTRELREWIAAEAGLSDWLVEDSYDQVGDLAETVTLLLDDPAPGRGPLPAGADAPRTMDPGQHERALDERALDEHALNERVPPRAPDDIGLQDWIEQHLLPVAGGAPEIRRAVVVDAWHRLPFDERLLFNKLLTGALRVGVSARLVQQALAELSGVDIALLAQRLLGAWAPSAGFLQSVLSTDPQPGDSQQPYPFFLASPLEAEPESLGHVDDWVLEWKWDGIRLQLIRRAGDVALWSRGEERLDGRFPEIEAAAATLPRDCVIDGELLGWHGDAELPLPFTALQTRIQRRKPGARTLAATPARVLAYDLIELDGEDLRVWPLAQRRAALEDLLDVHAHPQLRLSPSVSVTDWQHAAQLRLGARERGVEGLMLKRRESPYQSGRRRGDWWKWKIDPLTIDAVLVYAQAGHGRRSNLFTDYTLALWEGDALLPIAKAYSGLDDKEIASLDRWIRAHTTDRFGPVRAVEPVHVFELGFEAVNRSTRHKSGIAVRFPRILRWRHDKPAAEADRLESLRALAR